MHLTSFPHPVPLERYEAAVARVVAGLAGQPGVLAVYQVGGVRTPGISDIDLFVIFADGADCPADPLAGLGPADRYLFPHGQFGLCRRHFELAARYPFFHDFNLRWGEPMPSSPGTSSPGTSSQGPPPPGILAPGMLAPAGSLDAVETRLVHFQTGLEYLLKMFVSMTVEQTYGIVRVRNLLLLGRALLYDLDYVGIGSGRVVELVRQVVSWREVWFRSPPAAPAIVAWCREFHAVLRDVLETLFARQRLYLPRWADPRIAANMTLVPAERFDWEHQGITLPAVFGGLGRRYFNLQHRCNRFRFHVPIDSGAAGGAQPAGTAPGVLEQRHALVTEMTAYNRLHLPHFMPVSTALAVFRRRAEA